MRSAHKYTLTHTQTHIVHIAKRNAAAIGRKGVHARGVPALCSFCMMHNAACAALNTNTVVVFMGTMPGVPSGANGGG